MKIFSKRWMLNNFALIRTLFAVAIGYLVALICILFISEAPLTAILTFILKPFDGIRRIGSIIEYMIPITFTGLGMCMMLAVNRWNLVGDGALFLSASITALFATEIASDLPPIILPVLLVVIGAVTGACCAAVPAYVNAKWNTNIVVSTIMLNYVLILGGVYFLQYWMRDSSLTYVGSALIPEKAKMLKLIPGTNVHFGLIIALVMVFLVHKFLYSTKIGYQMRMIGTNPDFARISGMKVMKYMILAQIIGGALAGIGGTSEVLGRYDRFTWLKTLNYGFDGMMVAVIAKGKPSIIPFAAFFLSYIKIGADLVGQTTDVPSEFALMAQSIIIILVAAEDFLANRRQRLVNMIAEEDKGQKTLAGKET